MSHQRRWARLLAAILVASLFLPMLASAFAAAFPYEAVSMDDVNLRKRANTSSTILKRIKAGDTVTILGASGGYYQVKFEGQTGYAMKKYIDGTDSSPDPTPDASRTQQAPPAVMEYPYDTTVFDRVKLRKTAKADGDVIQTLLPDSVVTVYSLTENGFAKVKYEGKTGYVLSGYVNLANIPTPTPKPTATPKPGSESYTALQNGSSGSAVRALQEALAELGYLTAQADGKYGGLTEAAVKALQKRNGREETGVADQELQLLIYEGTPKDTRGYRQYVKTVAPIAGATIKEKSTGEAVERLQTRLKELSYYTGEITGKYDDASLSAMLAFELKHSLVQDGVADAGDQAVLYGATAMGASVVVTPTPSPTPAPPSGTVRRGDKGTDAELVQQRLKDLGYYTGKITGTFNEASEKALKDFQNKSKLPADGVCGPQTRTVLFGINAIYAVATAMPVLPKATTAPITEENVVIIRAGSRGDAVLRMQKRLQELGYYTSRQDGVYLTDDITAVRAFQSTNGLKVDGKAGFQTQSLLYSDSAIRGSSVTLPNATATLRYGSTGAEVTTLQNRLIELGYLTSSADGNFDLATKTSLMDFQRKNNLVRDGVAGGKTLAALNASTAISNKVTSSETLKIGSVSDAVKEMQSRLITLGYLSGKADGKFGVQTSLALIAFQKASGLTGDGIAGSLTLKKLNNTNATPPNGSVGAPDTSAPNLGGMTISAANVRNANWYTEVKARCRLYPNATIYDFLTGISWQVNMFSLGAHADSEPLTATDTANMNRAFGGKTTWTPKAVWVVFSDGRIYMASTHNTPHSPSHIRTNNFDGHLCIHFPRTQEQVQAIGPYATSHQKAIDLGWAATLKRGGQ